MLLNNLTHGIINNFLFLLLKIKQHLKRKLELEKNSIMNLKDLNTLKRLKINKLNTKEIKIKLQLLKEKKLSLLPESKQMKMPLLHNKEKLKRRKEDLKNTISS